MVEAKPSLIAKVRNADLLVCSGAQLEIGWLPQLLMQAGGPQVAALGPGNFMAASRSPRWRSRPASTAPAATVHPDGNPHIQLDPYRVLAVAKALDARLTRLDPPNAAAYQKNLADFETRWNAAIARWGSQGRAAAQARRWWCTTPAGSTCCRGWACTKIGRLETQARRAADQRAHLAGSSTPPKWWRHRHPVRRLPGSQAQRVAVRAHRCTGPDAALQRRRRRQDQDLFGLYDDTSTGSWER